MTVLMDAVRISEMSIYFCETARRHIPEVYHLHTPRGGNLGSPFYVNSDHFKVNVLCTYKISEYRQWGSKIVSSHRPVPIHCLINCSFVFFLSFFSYATYVGLSY
jgi:hypothetical protein